jgi:hypothetical protein
VVAKGGIKIPTILITLKALIQGIEKAGVKIKQGKFISQALA